MSLFLTLFGKKLKPIVVIDYYRKPYINKSGIYFRLTFDSNIKANKNKNLLILVMSLKNQYRVMRLSR